MGYASKRFIRSICAKLTVHMQFPADKPYKKRRREGRSVVSLDPRLFLARPEGSGVQTNQISAVSSTKQNYKATMDSCILFDLW